MTRYFMKIVWGVVCFLCAGGLAQAQEAGEPEVEVEAAQRGGVFQVNDAAVTSSEIIRGLLENISEALAQWRATLNEKEFIVKAQGPVAKASMAQVYNLLLYQHARKDFSDSDNYRQKLIW